MTLNYIRGIEPFTADIYQAKKVDKLSYAQIAQKYGITASHAHYLVNRANLLVQRGDFSWMKGLSTHAVTQLLKSKYKDAESLRYDVLHGLVDLEDLPHIGHKIAQEIYRWCVNYERNNNEH